MAEFISLDVSDRVATILLQRPPVNALNLAMQREIAAAAFECAERADVGAVVVYGGPKVFAAGADVKEMAAMSVADMERASLDIQAVGNALAAIPKPTIAAVTGYALGGGNELALACDLRVVAVDAKLGQPEILLGIIPGIGGTQRLARLVGPARAKDLVFSGRFIGAEEALRIGLVDRVVPTESVYDEAMAWARELANLPAMALAAAKRAIDQGLDEDLATGLEIERQAFAGLFATEDRTIGMASFVEHGPGKATFTHR